MRHGERARGAGRTRRSWQRLRAQLVVGCTAVFHTTGAVAQSPASSLHAPATSSASGAPQAPDTPSARADALFKEGLALLGSEKFADACAKFEESHKLDPAPGTAANIATCEERQGHFAAATRRWKEASERYPAGDSRRATAAKNSADAEAKTGRFILRPAPGAPAPLTVTLDNRNLGPEDIAAPIAVDGGPHQLVVSAPGHEPRTLEVEAVVGQEREITLAPGAASKPATPPVLPTASALLSSVVASPPTKTGFRYTGPAILGGTAVVLAGVGGALGIELITSAYPHWSRECQVECKDGIVARGVAINVAFGLAGAALAGAGVLFAIEWAKTPSSAKKQVRLTPGPAGLTLTVHR